MFLRALTIFIYIFLNIFVLNIYGQSTPLTYINGMVVPSDLPTISPSNDESDAGGKIFISNWKGRAYVMIYETDGTPYFYQKTENISIDFKVHQNGILSRNIRGDNGYFVLMDSNYNYIDSIQPKNGYGLDHHDFQITPDETFLIIAIENRNFDLSEIVEGGRASVRFRGNHVQEIDKDGNLLFEWVCWDHFDLTDTDKQLANVSSVDYMHMNSVGLDYDGHILISCRSFSECTKINKNTGEIIWRLGGKNNQFTFINDTIPIHHQHDFRAVPGHPNNYTIFDNGVPRAIQYYIDTTSMTAEKVWEYDSPERPSPGMGNAQRLNNGNTFINWAYGSLPKCTEVTPEGEIVYEISYSYESYRTFRFDWEGIMEEPYLTIEKYDEYVRAIYHKFGDTLVDHYNIYLNTIQDDNELYFVTDSCWYDLVMNSLQSYTKYYLKITAVNIYGEESGFSKTYSFTTGETDSYEYAIRGETKEVESTDPEWVESIFGNAFDFDGENDLVNCENYPKLQFDNPTMTIEALVRVDTINSETEERNIINKQDTNGGFKFYITDSAAIGFYITNGSWKGITTANNAILPNIWYHVAATYNGDSIKIFIDGEIVKEGNIPGSITNSSKSLYIGSSNLYPSNAFSGIIDEVRIWNTSRTQEQIQNFMDIELECKDTSLIGYWRFNEGEEQTSSNLVFENNQIRNHNFSDGLNDWEFNKADATTTTNEQGLTIDFIDAGGSFKSTQLIQNSLQLVNNVLYKLSFIAYAEEERLISINVQQSVVPNDDYAKIGYIQITEEPQIYSYEFIMENTSDFNAQLIFNLGSQSVNLTLNDISFGPKVENIPTCIYVDTNITSNPDTIKVNNNLLSRDIDISFYPNPVNTVGILNIYNAIHTRITYSVLDYAGKQIELSNEIIIPNNKYSIAVDLTPYPKGIYFIKIILNNTTGDKTSFLTLKVVK